MTTFAQAKKAFLRNPSAETAAIYRAVAESYATADDIMPATLRRMREDVAEFIH